MAFLNPEFRGRDRDLVLSYTASELLESRRDYVRLTIYSSNSNNVVLIGGAPAIFYSTVRDFYPFEINTSPFYNSVRDITTRTVGLGHGYNQGFQPGDEPPSFNDFKVYRNSDGNIYIKPNEILNTYGLPQGSYRIQIDFLNQVKPYHAAEHFINPTVVDGSGTTDETDEYLSTLPFPFYREEFLSVGLSAQGVEQGALTVIQTWGIKGRPDIAAELQTLYNADNELNNLPSADEHYQFVIKQISTTRKEIRLKLLDKNILNNSEIINRLTQEFNNFEPLQITDTNEFLEDGITPNPNVNQVVNNPNYRYQFKHVLNIGTGNQIAIMNYAFDRVTDGKDNQSIILRLYDQLPTQISNLSLVTIEKEVLVSQIEEVYYFSDVPEVFFGDGLDSQPEEDWINYNTNNVEFQNYNELSASLSDITLDNLVSSSYNYPNLNTDFTKFENHTFFGSAKKKLENFKAKVKTIQEHYTRISHSLSIDCSMDGDSDYAIQTRRNYLKR
jgi:hypothetical protein